MPTTVGTETTAADLIKNLLILEYLSLIHI